MVMAFFIYRAYFMHGISIYIPQRLGIEVVPVFSAAVEVLSG